MAFKRQHNMMSLFSMASMTDVIFLLLIFFMVTSTFVFPTALDVNLPESSAQTANKPTLRVFVDKELKIYTSVGEENPVPVKSEELIDVLKKKQKETNGKFVALYVDEQVPYGEVVKILEKSSRANLKMVLATQPPANNN